MTKRIDKLLEETEKLSRENKELLRQLREAKETIDLIKTGNIDALVVSHKNDLKVYTEKTTDKIFRTLIEQMNEGAVTLNKDGTILYCNSCFSKMVDLPLQKVIGAPFRTFIEDSSKKHFESLFKQGWEVNSQNEICINTTGGKVKSVLMSANTLSVDNTFTLSVILTDLTIQNKNQGELKVKARQLERNNIDLENANKELAFQNNEKEKHAAELSRANNDLTTFTYVSSHDLQEPLRKIQIFASCILNEKENHLSDKAKKYFQRMQETANRMQRLIEDLLTYSRTKSDERVFESTDLNLLLNEIKVDLEDIISAKKAVIEASNLCQVSVIPFQFRQLLFNLMMNSLKFSKPNIPPHIVIENEVISGNQINKSLLLSLRTASGRGPDIQNKLSSQKKYCHITFTDKGIGFDPKYKDRIFEVFQRLHSFDEYPGTGIGLAICKRIVENHGGIIKATGELNKGARFDIYIPAE